MAALLHAWKIQRKTIACIQRERFYKNTLLPVEFHVCVMTTLLSPTIKNVLKDLLNGRNVTIQIEGIQVLQC